MSLSGAVLRCGCVDVSYEALVVSLRLHNSPPPGCLRIYEVQKHEWSGLLGGEVSAVVWFSDLSQICVISIVKRRLGLVIIAAVPRKPCGSSFGKCYI